MNLALHQEVTHKWVDKYGLIGNIVGVEEYKSLTQVQTYQVPQEPDVCKQAVNNNHEAHEYR